MLSITPQYSKHHYTQLGLKHLKNMKCGNWYDKGTNGLAVLFHATKYEICIDNRGLDFFYGRYLYDSYQPYRDET